MGEYTYKINGPIIAVGLVAAMQKDEARKKVIKAYKEEGYTINDTDVQIGDIPRAIGRGYDVHCVG